MSQGVQISGRREEFALQHADFEKISRIAKSGWGLSLDEAKKPLIKSRLSKRLRALGLASFDDYCRIIEVAGQEERDHFVSALTTNVTHFFRELHHFEYLETELLPGLIARAKAGERIRIWSAGCSSGKEPYSIAATILKLDPSATSYDLKILASDVDDVVLRTAEAGKYHPSDSTFPTEQHKNIVFGSTQASQNEWTVRPELKPLVAFRNLNLMAEWPMTGLFDIIMCRNVAIYFDKATQAQLWAQFCKYLKVQGHLFIGHSERIGEPDKFGLTMCNITTYSYGGSPSAQSNRVDGDPKHGA